MEALIYSIHEIKHALDAFGEKIGFEDEATHEGVGRNEGETQRFATDMAEEILGEKVEPTVQKSLGISLLTNLDEYQLEDRMNELFCKAIGISRAEFLRTQNSQDMQEFDENGNFLEKETTPEQTARAMYLISQCQHEVTRFIEKTNPEMLTDIQKEFIKSVIEEQTQEPELLNQSNYLKYQEDVLNQTDFKLVFVTEFRYDHERHPKLVYFKSGDKYLKTILPVAEDGSVSLQDIQDVTDISEIVTEIEDYKSESGIIGNAYEYIELLKMQGRDEDAEIILKKQEYFESQKDKIFELENQSMKNEKMMDDIFSSFYNDVLNSDDLSHSIDDFLEEEFASFTYNGVNYTVDSTGFCQQVEQTGNVILVKQL